MPTFDNIALEETSTVTARVASVVIARGSTNEDQEILVLGDPDTSNALAAITNAAPLSTRWGLNVRIVGGPSSAADLALVVSSLAGAVMTRSSAADHLVTAYQSTAGDFLATVSPSAGSTWSVRPLQSSAADLQMTATPVAGSTWNVRPLQSSAADLQMTATPVAGSTWNVRPLQSSAADLQMTATPAAGSTFNVRPLQSSQADLRITAYQSTAADLNVSVAGYSTTVNVSSLAGSVLVADSSGVKVGGSTGPVNRGDQGLLTREIGYFHDSTTASSATNGSSGDHTILSSATSTAYYVYAYSVISTATTKMTWRFLNGSTNEVWSGLVGSESSGVTGANLAVGKPAWLFRTSPANALILNLNEAIAVRVSVAAFKQST